MEEIISGYRRLLNLLEEEREQASRCLEGELLESYRQILDKEKDRVAQNLRVLQQNLLM